jgi:hypothetical protein
MSWPMWIFRVQFERWHNVWSLACGQRNGKSLWHSFGLEKSLELSLQTTRVWADYYATRMY